MNTILTGDCLQVMPTLPENSVDSVICDPPYGLDFMGKSWDHGVPGMEFWQATLRVAKPGAILMAFGGTRTFHRLACAIEDAGWEIRDTMMFLYGQGFPKSLDISKAIDKKPNGYLAAQMRDTLNQYRIKAGLSVKQVNEYFGFATTGSGVAHHWMTHPTQPTVPTEEQYQKLKRLLHIEDESLDALYVEAQRESIGTAKNWGKEGTVPISGYGEWDITAPSTPAAHLWQGWGTALKPAWEPIIVAMKPLEGTYAENAQKWGVAGLNIDGGRIPTDDSLGGGMVSMGRPKASEGWDRPWMHDPTITEPKKAEEAERVARAESLGRWPANLLLDEEAAAQLDQMSGELTSGKPAGVKAGGQLNCYGVYKGGIPVTGIGDSGGASRFFYTAKASSSERNAGLEDCEKQDIYTEESINPHRDERKPNGHANVHPTVKPVSLMRYLCKLTRTPTGGVVLDPFMGSGTTGIACILEHRDFIGIEIDENYAEIARKRIADMTGPLFIMPEVKHGKPYLYN